MRVFLSAYSGFTLAVPMNAVAAMMLYNQKTEKTVQYDQKSRSTYVSLPRLFRLPDEVVRHGIILREWNSKANKVVLLTAEVKRDIEIPDEQFHPLPKAFGALRFSEIFSGIQFSDNPVLLLNIEQLAEYIQREQWVLDTHNEQQVPTNGEIQPPVSDVQNEQQAVTESEDEAPVSDVQNEQQAVTEPEDEAPVPDVQEEQQAVTEPEDEPPVPDVQEEQQAITEPENEDSVSDIQFERQVLTDVEDEVPVPDVQDEQQVIDIQDNQQVITIQDDQHIITIQDDRQIIAIQDDITEFTRTR